MLAAIVALAAWAATAAPNSKEHTGQQQPQTIGVQSNQKPDSATHANRDDGSRNKGGSQTPPAKQTSGGVSTPNACGDECQRRAEERSEYWIVFNHRFKITDFLLSLFTFLLVVVGGVQSLLLDGTIVATSKAASEANSTARDAIAAANRPWLDVEVVPGSTIKWDARGLTLSFAVKFSNRGNSPAHKVFLIAFAHVDFTPGKDRFEEAKAVSEAQAELLGDGDWTIFQGKDITMSREFTFTDAEIGAAEAYLANVIGIGPPERKGNRINVVAAVGYEIPFSPLRHQTRFHLNFYRQGTGLLGGFDRASGDVAAPDVQVQMSQITAD